MLVDGDHDRARNARDLPRAQFRKCVFHERTQREGVRGGWGLPTPLRSQCARRPSHGGLTRMWDGLHHPKILLLQVIAELLATLLAQNGPRILHFCERSLAVEAARDNF